MQSEQDLLAAEQEKRLREHVLFVSATYILTIGVSGLVLCAIGSNLTNIAATVGVQATALGGHAFLCRGFGAILGAVNSSWIYKVYEGDQVLCFGLLGIAALLTAIPFSSSTLQVYVYFFGLGICSAINDTGCNIMIRKVHGKKAGPWLGANGVSFGMSAAVVPIVELMSSDFKTQYHTLAVLVLLIATLVLYGMTGREALEDHQLQEIRKKQQELSQLLGKQKQIDQLVPHYWVESCISFMVFSFVGGQVDTVAYMASYLDQTGLVAPSHRSNVLLVFWISVSIGRVVGVLDQRSLTDSTLILHLSICCILGSASLLLCLVFSHTTQVLWASVALYALFYGPTVAYCHDLNNRLTLPTEQSTSIVMFGINCGASFVPYLTSVCWNEFRDPTVLIGFVLMSMSLPLPFVLASRYLSYKKSLEGFKERRPSTFFEYDSISNRKFKAAAGAVMAINRMSRLFRGSVTEATAYGATESTESDELRNL